jgi:hypothetical protein
MEHFYPEYSGWMISGACTGDRNSLMTKSYFRQLKLLRMGARVLLALSCPAALLAQGANPCDLTGDGTVNSADVTLAVSMALGQAACTGNVSGTGACNVVAVQRVVNAALTGTCLAGNPHAVSIAWVASLSYSVVGYNVYRTASPSSPFVKLTTSPVAVTSFSDSGVQAGQIYYYAVTSVDNMGNESAPSPSVTVSVPLP